MQVWVHELRVCSVRGEGTSAGVRVGRVCRYEGGRWEALGVQWRGEGVQCEGRGCAGVRGRVVCRCEDWEGVQL